MQGKVVSTKMKNTVIVEVERLVAHPIYKKRVRKSKRFAAHVEQDLQVGALVELIEIKPMSKTKRFKVSRTLTKEETAKK